MNSKKNIILLVLMVIILGVYFYKIGRDNSSTNLSNEKNNDQASTTVVDLGNGLVAVGKGDFKVEKISEGNLVKEEIVVPKPIPNLNRQVIFSSDISSDTKSIIQNKINEIVSSLNKNPADLPSWIDLGLYHKMAGDYSGAIIYFNYAGKLSPINFVSFSNLGDLYGFYLKDVAQSEINYNIAIKNGPKQEYLYYQLASVYRDVSMDKDKAKETIERGLKVLPDSNYLKGFLETLK